MKTGYCMQSYSPEAAAHNQHKSILIIMPTIGEVMQSYQLCKELKKIFHDTPVYAVVESNDAESTAGNISEIDGLYTYKNDSSSDAAHLLRKTNPSIILFIENCYYPRLLIEADGNNITTMLISAVMNSSIRNHPRYKHCFSLDAHKVFSFVGVKSSKLLKNFISLGVEEEKLFISGDLKIDHNRLLLSDNERQEYKKILGLEGKKVFMAGSISEYEGKIIIDTFEKLITTEENIKCIIAPRFLDNIKDVKKYAEEASLSVSLKSVIKDEPAKNEADIILLDSYGELGRMYGLADAVFVGGTLKPFPGKPLGQNILEPLFHGKPLIVGPNVKKDYDVIETLRTFWSGTVVRDSEELFHSIVFLLANKDFRKDYAQFIKDSIRFDSSISGLMSWLAEIRNKITMI